MIVFVFLLMGCCFLVLYRVAKGPTSPDRTVAIDILGILIVGFCALMSIITGKDLYMTVALSWALLSFIGTIALAKYLERKSFDE